MGVTKVAIVLILSVLVQIVSSDEFLYKETRICARHKSSHCFSYDSTSTLLVLDRKHRLKFDVETVERVNMVINRIYTNITNSVTGEKVKSCLVKKATDSGASTIGLALCDTEDSELVLSVSAPEEADSASEDQFTLQEISYVEGRADVTTPLCVTMAQKNDNSVLITGRSQIKRKTPLLLRDCAVADGYSQDFKAKGFAASTSTRMITETEAALEKIGRFCLSEKPDLCLGISLTNGTILENNKFLQIKNYTKNEAKELDNLKMRWYHDVSNEKIVAAAHMDYCLEGIYNAPIGQNRPGVEQYDDIVHLGECDPNRAGTTDGFRGLASSELFYTQTVTTATESYVEIRTDVPFAARDNTTDESTTKCASVVKCVKHDGDHCTKYNSVAVYDDVEELEQGAYVRLKDCDSTNMVSQRFFYVQDTDLTVPPTKYPTPQPTATEGYPSVSPTRYPSSLPTPKPTESPETSTEPIPPTTGTDEGGADSDDEVSTSDPGVALKAGLAFVGILCLAVIVAGAAYYYKHKNDFQELPDEDENFIARV